MEKRDAFFSKIFDGFTKDTEALIINGANVVAITEENVPTENSDVTIIDEANTREDVRKIGSGHRNGNSLTIQVVAGGCVNTAEEARRLAQKADARFAGGLTQRAKSLSRRTKKRFNCLQMPDYRVPRRTKRVGVGYFYLRDIRLLS